ncbi:MAG: LPS assembly protein LptD [Candidatus Omnitrophota bacterium]
MKARLIIIGTVFMLFSVAILSANDKEKKGSAAQEPVVVNGDVVEYSAESKNVTASGKVSVEYKGAKLTCEKLTVNTETKQGWVEGNVRIDDEKGVIEAEKGTYNFQDKSGTLDDADFRSDPYFGRAKSVKKVSDKEFIASHGYVSTCSMDRPHYRIKSRRVKFFPKNKVETKDDILYLGQVPVAYIPEFSRSFADPLMHVQLSPGKRKEWGAYMLSAWRYSLTENADGRIYFDYRNKLGTAEGVGLNYRSENIGKGDFKFYYTDEDSRNNRNDGYDAFQRYMVRWRHKWDIDERTNFTSELYKISDQKRKKLGSDDNFLRDYFYREYEKESEPLSYGLLHHSFNYSSLDVLVQKRVNHWFTDQDERLPEIQYSMPSIQLGDSPFYLQDNTSYVNYSYNDSTSTAADQNVTYSKLDSANKLSLPLKVSFLRITPFASAEGAYYNKNTYGATSQVALGTGTDISTKFYRLFNVNSNFLGLDIHGLRHILTPTVSYSYTNTSTMPATKARFGGGASVGDSSVTMELANRLQTKRKGQTALLADFRINTSYDIKPKTTTGKTGSSLGDIVFDLDLWPYSWMSIVGDATYTHSGLRSDPNYNTFSNANIDFNFNIGEDRTIGIGQRYQRKAGKELTFGTKWRINPKWKFGIYERYQFADTTDYPSGLREQEYSIIRDLHCWTMELTYNAQKDHGNSIWLVFRLKAFPENEFSLDQSYHEPKPGSQSSY